MDGTPISLFNHHNNQRELQNRYPQFLRNQDLEKLKMATKHTKGIPLVSDIILNS